MSQAFSYRPAFRTSFCSSKARQTGQLGSTTLRAGSLLAALCLLIGFAFAAYVPASLEERIGNLFFFGLIPAAGFYGSGHVIGHFLVLGSRLCEIIAASFFRCCLSLVKSFIAWVSSSASHVSIEYFMVLAIRFLSKLSVLAQKTCRSIRHRCWRAHTAFGSFLCLLIRNAAKFAIRMQAYCSRLVSNVFRRNWRLRPLIVMSMLLTAFSLGWIVGGSNLLFDLRRDEPAGGTVVDAVIERIIGIESNGDPNAKNKRSSATGLGQFLDETWLDLIRTHRPDLAKGRSHDKILELRRDAKLARELTIRFTEQNAGMLRKRGLPVTPGTLYLAHFAGGAGAVAILSALDDSDAASVMASADATGRTKREKIIKANPFLERFTVADLRSWADRRMRVPGS